MPTRVDAAKNVVSAAVVTLSVFAVSARADKEEINKFRDLISPPEVKEHLEADALKTKGVAVKLIINRRGNGQIKLEDHGKKNPVAVAPPGNSIKFVDISAEDIGFEYAEVRIQYTDGELGGADENRLVIYHWNGAVWDALATSVDAANNMLRATTSSLSPFAVSAAGGEPVLRVATNRYVILDDYWATANYWNGEATTIRAYALVLNSSSLPANGIVVNFTLRYPNGTTLNSSLITTDASGIASYYFDLDDRDVYGDWTINASATVSSTPVNQSRKFIYNKWGCDNCHGSNRNPGQYDIVTPNSLYMKGYDKVHANTKGMKTDHQNKVSNSDCIYCHRSYGSGSAGSQYPPDYHNGKKTCQACHNNDFTGGNGIPDMRSCNNASCHVTGTSQKNKNLTQPSTLNSSSLDSDGYARTKYSDTVPTASGSPLKYHGADASVPCIICHNSMHNTTKPDPSVSITSNITEYTQCTACHNAYKRHNNTVNCIVCHSHDAHIIKVFAQNATYINGSTSSFRGNCTSCHQNSTFMNALLAQPRAGSYSGNVPQIPKPMYHSNDPSAGRKWNTTPYWTNGTEGSAQLSSCKYCHGETLHKTSALGRPSLWKGSNTVNSTIGNTTWCSSCHWQGYARGTNTSSDMINTFTGDSLLVPPEITGNTTYGANQSIYEYTNHSLYTNFYSNLNDSACNRCHGYRYGFTTITRLVHNQTRVGGANCADCHDINGIVLLSHINVTTSNDTNALHKNLNSGASASNATAYYSNNRRCWACHSNGSEPSTPYAHPTKYRLPYNCTNCHIQGAGQNFNFTPSAILNVTEHYWNATDIHTPAVSTCYACHNLSEMMIFASDPDSGSGAVYGGANGGNNSSSHYGKKRADLRIGASANCSYCHQNTSSAFASAMLDPAYNTSIFNHSLRYNSSNPTCITSQCHSTGWIHNSTLFVPNLTLPNTTFCLGCHGKNATSGMINFTGAVTSIKEKHNNSVNCTDCHLDTGHDIHPVKYLQPEGIFNTSNSTAANCVLCHQTGIANFSNAPRLPSMHHSDDISNGSRWNLTEAYWTNTSQQSRCNYCHGDSRHSENALGRPANWSGLNIINSSIANNSNWCSGCHYQGYTSGAMNYNNMVLTFEGENMPVPPEISNHSSFAPYSKNGYFNHTLSPDYSDSTCKTCHGVFLPNGTKMDGFMHNVSTGTGTCSGCHFSYSFMSTSSAAAKFVNQSMYNSSAHGSLACEDCHTKGHKNIGARKACEDCHAYQQDPINDMDRHNITGTPAQDVVNNTICTSCHDAGLYNNATAQYGYGKTYDCNYCHTYPDNAYS